MALGSTSKPVFLCPCILTLYFLACGCQIHTYTREVYPLGPETAWTRTSWPELRLRFPYEHLRKAELESYGLHSANGPYDTQYYRIAAAQQPRRSRVVQGLQSAADSGTLLRCSTCNILLASVWETARHMVHSSGELPMKKGLAQLLASSCDSEIPGIMKAFGAVMAKAGSGNVDATIYEPETVSATCQQLIKDSKGGTEGSTRVAALWEGLQQYIAQLNSHTAQRRKAVFSAEMADPDSCQDYHSMCTHWAAQGECDKNPKYMTGSQQGAVGHCRASCGVCLVHLASGELPKPSASVELAAKQLLDVQHNACNASGICEGVDPRALPKVASFPLDSGMFSKPALRRWLEGNTGAPPLPAVRSPPQEAVLEIRQRIATLPKDECFYANQGWWTYELCLERHVRQFHVDARTARMEHFTLLGNFDADHQPEQTEDQLLEPELLLPGMMPDAVAYVKAHYRGGSLCTADDEGLDIEREVEVRMACSPDNDGHLAVHEPKQCRYIVVLFSPGLCTGASFPAQAEHNIKILDLVHQEL